MFIPDLKSVGSAGFGSFTNASALDDNPARRLIDIVFVLAVAPFVLLFSALVIIILKSSEPQESVFFGTLRYGKHGKAFTMWKFRTMRNDPHLVGCEKVIRKFAPELNFKLASDPRISKFGAVLRRTHFDELPQLMNVLKGDMSLFGPRPNSLHPSRYEPWQLERLSVRPGLTGPWQVFGDRKVRNSERFEQDIEYIRTRTLKYDAMLLLHTLWHCINRRGMV